MKSRQRMKDRVRTMPAIVSMLMKILRRNSVGSHDRRAVEDRKDGRISRRIPTLFIDL